ncbi:MAG TPA: acyltransferase family protein, partial [Thermoanaerobaculia bacterium]|nr:acyltransferase family protein [Thermoanaerobaculia bacterium]
MTASSGRVDELDGLRGLLALWVAVSHVFCWTGFAALALPRPLGRLWTEFVYAGPAVEIFMILSGFAIAFLLVERGETHLGFLRGRLFRIYPVYLAALAVALASSAVTPFVLRTAAWRDVPYFQMVGTFVESERAAPGTHLLWHLTLLNGA